MLAQIDKIDWANLKHAYGSAADVPKHIRNLTSPDEKVRDNTFYCLYGNIFHQGTRYEATPYAIPFLYELIANETIKDRDKIISFLINLALGYEEEYLPDGINPEKFRNELRESDANMTEEERMSCEKYGYKASALIDCYDFVKEGIPILLNCLKSEDESIRTAALYAISWFPEEAEKTIPHLLEVLSQIEGEIEIANALLGIGLLHKQAPKNIDLSVIHYHLHSEVALLRICSAIALAKSPIEGNILDTLIEGIKSAESLNYVEGILFNEGMLSGYISTILSQYGKAEKEKIIPALCKMLESVNAYQSLDITSAIMSIINDKRTKTLKSEKLADLNALEIAVLHSIYEYGGWRLGTSDFANYAQLLRSAGIPDSKEKLGKFLANESFE